MKDLTAYFGSPSNESCTSAKEAPESNKKAEEKNEPIKTAGDGSANRANNNEDVDVKTVAKRKKKSKKDKLRKPSDPAVKNITELMTNNLSIISPNNSVAEIKTVDSSNCVGAEVKCSNKSVGGVMPETKGSDESKNGTNIKINISSDKVTETISVTEDSNNSSIVTETEAKTSSENYENPIMETAGHKKEERKEIIDCDSSNSSDIQGGNLGKTKAVNAFQFLMNSRFKTIGSNSPGKEVDKEISKDEESKEKLSTRKHLLSDWAEKKGASKRKREEEEKEATISYKLEKRAKRLKKLLKVEADNDAVVKTRRRCIKRLSTDSENSNDATIQRANTVDIKNENEKYVIKSDAEENKKKLHDIKEITRINECETLQDGDLTTKSLAEIEKKCNEVISIIDDKKIKNKEISAKSTSKTKTSHRKLKKQDNIEKENKNTEELHEILDESAQDIEICTPKPKEGRQSLLNFFGVINKSDKIENVNSKTSLRIQSEEVTIKESCQVKNSVKKVNLDVVEVELDAESESAVIDTVESKVVIDLAEEELICTTHNITETEDTSTCDQAPQTCKRKKSKKKKKHKEEKTPKVQRIVDESSQEIDDLTPRRLRSWRMKIRMNMDENTDENSVDKVTKIDENSCDVTLSSGSDFEEEIKTKKPSKKPVKVAPVFVKAIPKPKIDPDVLEARKQFLMSGIPDSLKKCMEKQQSLEDREYDVFPTISHVQQKCNSNFWNLPESNLELTEFSLSNLMNSTSLIVYLLQKQNS